MAKVSDEVILDAIRQRILDEVRKRDRAAAVVNNVYGGSIPSPGSGVSDQMGFDQVDPGAFDYMVDIERNPVIDPETGMAVEGAWKKKVHRYRQPKGSDLTDDKIKKKKKNLESKKISADEFFKYITSPVAPENYAGEGFTATDEIARSADIDNPFVRGRVGNEDAYWPAPQPKKNRRY